ncbi:acetyltransferase [Sphingomonas sp. SUN019]|uniref:acetyltransferase n=1 Tax=Sphingomonas sp. SUN019 TaxID=2937788 RepID=UPI002164AD2F|nr:acetyltransferase [Sphingomonas sp. SUN019]UVO50433.1 acetyltransferase [Sphingomonas sp. SUN019]
MPCSVAPKFPAISAEPYSFRAMTWSDLPMVRRWLATPAARKWWGDPAREEGLLREDMDEPAMSMLIVAHNGEPFAYAQHYAVHTWPQPQFQHLPPGARAIDTFIGKPTMLGRGHGTAFLRVLARHLREHGVPEVAIDPDITNYRARRAYARAGFTREAIVAGAAKRPAVVMLFRD